MDPRDINRINYNNYYVGQNLDFLVRSKMRSESLSTPLKNTPVFYDDQVSSKMSLLGKRGYYDPGYIYGFDNQNNEKKEYMSNMNNINNNINYYNKSPQRNTPYNLNERNQNIPKEQNSRNNFAQDQYELEMKRRQEFQRRDNYNDYNNNNKNNNNIRNEHENFERTNQQNNEIKQLNNIEQNFKNINNNNTNNNYIRDKKFQEEYNDYLNRKNQETNLQNNNKNGKDNNYNVEGYDGLREQIQYDVFYDNYKNKQKVKQMMIDDEMKYRQKDKVYQYKNK